MSYISFLGTSFPQTCFRCWYQLDLPGDTKGSVQQKFQLNSRDLLYNTVRIVNNIELYT